MAQELSPDDANPHLPHPSLAQLGGKLKQAQDGLADATSDQDYTQKRVQTAHNLESQALRPFKNKGQTHFKILYDGIGLFEDKEMDDESFAVVLEKDSIIPGTYISNKVVLLGDPYNVYCSAMNVEPSDLEHTEWTDTQHDDTSNIAAKNNDLDIPQSNQDEEAISSSQNNDYIIVDDDKDQMQSSVPSSDFEQIDIEQEESGPPPVPLQTIEQPTVQPPPPPVPTYDDNQQEMGDNDGNEYENIDNNDISQQIPPPVPPAYDEAPPPSNNVTLPPPVPPVVATAYDEAPPPSNNVTLPPPVPSPVMREIQKETFQSTGGDNDNDERDSSPSAPSEHLSRTYEPPAEIPPEYNRDTSPAPARVAPYSIPSKFALSDNQNGPSPNQLQIQEDDHDLYNNNNNNGNEYMNVATMSEVVVVSENKNNNDNPNMMNAAYSTPMGPMDVTVSTGNLLEDLDNLLRIYRSIDDEKEREIVYKEFWSGYDRLLKQQPYEILKIPIRVRGFLLIMSGNGLEYENYNNNSEYAENNFDANIGMEPYRRDRIMKHVLSRNGLLQNPSYIDKRYLFTYFVQNEIFNYCKWFCQNVFSLHAWMVMCFVILILAQILHVGIDFGLGDPWRAVLMQALVPITFIAMIQFINTPFTACILRTLIEDKCASLCTPNGRISLNCLIVFFCVQSLQPNDALLLLGAFIVGVMTLILFLLYGRLDSAANYIRIATGTTEKLKEKFLMANEMKNGILDYQEIKSFFRSYNQVVRYWQIDLLVSQYDLHRDDGLRFDTLLLWFNKIPINHTTRSNLLNAMPYDMSKEPNANQRNPNISLETGSPNDVAEVGDSNDEVIKKQYTAAELEWIGLAGKKYVGTTNNV